MQNKKTLLVALALAGLGGFVAYTGFALPYSSEFGPGPGFLPLWLGLAILILALGLASVTQFGSAGETDEDSGSWFGTGRALSAWLALTVSIALLPKLGFALSFALLAAFLIVALDRRRLWIALCVGVSMAAAFHLIFVTALGASLPSGPWGF
ncbi:MAG: tripartite tricarboxylate transporter TctB family protein [Candidatus Binatia bacterium]